MNDDAEPAGRPGGEGKGSIVRFGDALDDRQAEPDTCVVVADAFAAALKRLVECGNQLWGELLAGVFNGENHAVGLDAGRDPYGAVLGKVVDDRVVHKVRSHLQQERG